MYLIIGKKPTTDDIWIGVLKRFKISGNNYFFVNKFLRLNLVLVKSLSIRFPKTIRSNIEIINCDEIIDKIAGLKYLNYEVQNKLYKKLLILK